MDFRSPLLLPTFRTAVVEDSDEEVDVAGKTRRRANNVEDDDEQSLPPPRGWHCQILLPVDAAPSPLVPVTTTFLFPRDETERKERLEENKGDNDSDDEEDAPKDIWHAKRMSMEDSANGVIVTLEE